MVSGQGAGTTWSYLLDMFKIKGAEALKSCNIKKKATKLEFSEDNNNAFPSVKGAVSDF